MRDVLVNKLAQAANELSRNLDKEVHIQDVLRRLSSASEQYPYDFVVRNMEDVFRKQAQNNPHRIVSGEEFESVRQALWGLNPNSAVRDFFPDLVFRKEKEKLPDFERTFANDNVRAIASDRTDAKTVEEARKLVLKAFQKANVHYPQTNFVRSVFAGYDDAGQPTEGILMFQASVITKSGNSLLSVPVMMVRGELVEPDNFASDNTRYPLSKKGVSDFSLGLGGIKTDSVIEDPGYIFASNEVRDIPVVDNSAQELINDAKTKIFDAFRDAGVNNCQIRFASFKMDDHDSAGIMDFDVKLPFAVSEIKVPVTVDSALVYIPMKFASQNGQEFNLSKDGLGQFLTTHSVNDSSGIVHRIAGEGHVRDILPQNKNDFRGLVSQKLATDLKKFGATNPQVFFVTSSEAQGSTAAAFVGTFTSKKGECQIAIPITIQGHKVKTPPYFVGENEKQYSFSADGLKSYVTAKSGFTPDKVSDFYGAAPVNPALKANEIDLNSRAIARQEGFESKSRVITPLDNRLAKLIAGLRDLIASDFEAIGAQKPQVYFDKKEAKDNGTVLRFSASFFSNKGVKQAKIPVLLSKAGLVRPEKFLGEDSKAYEFSKNGLISYLVASEAPTSDMEAKITSKLNSISFDKLRAFVKEAFAAGDQEQVTSALSSIKDRFGEDAAKNCFADLALEANVVSNDLGKQCRGCPFFQSGKDPKSNRTADTCLKFQTRVANVRFGGHHSQCSLTKLATEPVFDGSIMTSKIKLT